MSYGPVLVIFTAFISNTFDLEKTRYDAGMKTLLIGLLLTFSMFSFAQNNKQSKKLIPAKNIVQSRDCILAIVADYMKVTLKSEVALPRVRTQSDTSLKEFQDSIEVFWKFRPDVFTNVYNPIHNEIFIMTERAYYQKHKRSVFDSVAHELVHYVQKEYKGVDFTQEDESVEFQAIEVQTWFRDTYKNNFKKDQFICPST